MYVSYNRTLLLEASSELLDSMGSDLVDHQKYPRVLTNEISRPCPIAIDLGCVCVDIRGNTFLRHSYDQLSLRSRGQTDSLIFQRQGKISNFSRLP